MLGNNLLKCCFFQEIILMVFFTRCLLYRKTLLSCCENHFLQHTHFTLLFRCDWQWLNGLITKYLLFNTNRQPNRQCIKCTTMNDTKQIKNKSKRIREMSTRGDYYTSLLFNEIACTITNEYCPINMVDIQCEWITEGFHLNFDSRGYNAYTCSTCIGATK